MNEHSRISPKLIIPVQDFILKTRHMTMQELGAFNLLLCWAISEDTWAIPDNDRQIAAFLNLDLDEWGAIKQAVFFDWRHVSFEIYDDDDEDNIDSWTFEGWTHNYARYGGTSHG